MRLKNRFFLILGIAYLIIGCAGSPPSPEKATYGPGTIVAVWNLEDLSPIRNEQTDLGDFISATIIESLENRCGFKIVEREKLILALEELNLGSSQLASEGSLLELGKILGAKLMLFGAYQDIGGIVRLDLRLVEVERGLIVNAASNEVAAQDLDARIEGIEKATTALCESF